MKLRPEIEKLLFIADWQINPALQEKVTADLLEAFSLYLGLIQSRLLPELPAGSLYIRGRVK